MNFKQILGSIAKAYRNYRIFIDGILITLSTIIIFLQIVSVDIEIGLYVFELLTGLIFILYILRVLAQSGLINKKLIYYLGFTILAYMLYIPVVYYYMKYGCVLFSKFPIEDYFKYLNFVVGGVSAVLLALIIFAFTKIKLKLKLLMLLLILNTLSIIPITLYKDQISSIFFWQSSFSFYLYLVVKKARTPMNETNIHNSELQNITS
jgi:hypothetical protein